MPVVVSESELSRIRASVKPAIQTDKESRRLQLKQQSQSRTNKWPNTLEATRRKKDNWRKDKEERDEQRRLAIDAHEMELQKQARLRQIETANQLLYDQTDKMKTLRSKQLQADVIQDRKIQLQEQQFLKMQKLKQEERWDALLVQQLKDADEKEKVKERNVQRKNSKMASDQKEQLEQYKQRYISYLREEKTDGELIKAKAKRDIEMETQAEKARRLRAKQANEETRIANEQLQALRAKQREKEKLEDEKREDEARKKEEILRKRNELQRIKNEKIQARKQRMIDLAIEHLANLENTNETRLDNQKQEVQEKQDKELRYRAERRALDAAVTEQSRQHQLKLKRDQKRREEEEAKVLVKQWARHNVAVENDEKRQEIEQKMEEIELSLHLKSQADARRNRMMEEKVSKLLAEENARNILDEEDKKYRVVAKAALDEATKDGVENTFPLKAALAAKSIDLLPASGFRA